MGEQRYKEDFDLRAAVASAARGEEEGFRLLYDATYHDKFFIALKYMKNEQDAADVIQDAYLRAWKNMHTLKDPERFYSWFSVIVANCALNALKRKKPMLFSEIESTTEDGMDLPYDEEDLRAEIHPERALTQKENAALLLTMLDELPDEQRICILLFYVEEWSVTEIAQAIGCPRGTVLSRLNYGRKKLREIYKNFTK